MMWLAVFVNVPGKILYQFVSYKTCQYWGNQETICHLHDGETLGHYLCYLTLLFLSLGLLFKILVWFFCKDLQLYKEAESKAQESIEIRELIEQASKPEQMETPPNNSKYLFYERRTRIRNYYTKPFYPESSIIK